MGESAACTTHCPVTMRPSSHQQILCTLQAKTLIDAPDPFIYREYVGIERRYILMKMPFIVQPTKLLIIYIYMSFVICVRFELVFKIMYTRALHKSRLIKWGQVNRSYMLNQELGALRAVSNVPTCNTAKLGKIVNCRIFFFFFYIGGFPNLWTKLISSIIPVSLCSFEPTTSTYKPGS